MMTDTERLNFLEKMIRNCGHTSLSSDDAAMLEGKECITLSIEGCQPLDVAGKDLREILDIAYLELESGIEREEQ